MKIKIAALFVTPLCLVALSPELHAQSSTGPGGKDWQQWTATARDDCSTTMENTNFVADPATGALIPDVHRITAVATGLNYLDDTGAYRESQDLIELLPDGRAAGLRAPHKAYFPQDLTTEIMIVTKSNRTFPYSADRNLLFRSRQWQIDHAGNA